ncbi:MAG: hypothetical protein WCV82_04180 [Candidatus Paceibacterota bacterium]|jgi:hypothetical protein
MTKQANTTWYFEPGDAFTNDAFVSLGDKVEACEGKTVIPSSGEPAQRNVFRVDSQEVIDYILNSRISRQLSYTLYRKVGEGDILQYRVKQKKVAVRLSDPIAMARARRRKFGPGLTLSEALRKRPRSQGVH